MTDTDIKGVADLEWIRADSKSRLNANSSSLGAHLRRTVACQPVSFTPEHLALAHIHLSLSSDMLVRIPAGVEILILVKGDYDWANDNTIKGM